jgi:hypothetical protein
MPPENLFNFNSLEEMKKHSLLSKDSPERYGKYIEAFIYGLEKEPSWWKLLLESNRLSRTETGGLFINIERDTQAPHLFEVGDTIQKIGVSIHHHLNPFTHG